MKRTNLDHATLAAAHDARDWDTLMGAGLSWVRFALTKMQRRGVIRVPDIDEDLYQEGALALWRAVQAWDPLQYKFSSHIILYIEGAMMNYSMRQAMNGIGSEGAYQDHGPLMMYSLQDPDTQGRDVEHGEDSNVQDQIDYQDMPGGTPEGLDLPENEVARAMTSHIVEQLMAELPSEDAALMRAVYQQEQTFRDYGKIVGLSHSTLARRAEKIRQRLHHRLEFAVVPTTRCSNPNGVEQHYLAPPSFWASTAGPTTTVLADMPGRSYWSEKLGKVYGDWVWKPQPRDIPPKRMRKVAV